MIDQYIYTRSDGKKRTTYNGGKTFGFGMLAFTQGINEQLLDQLAKVSKYGFQDDQEMRVPKDPQGRQLRILTKRKVPKCGEYATFQQSYQLYHLPAGEELTPEQEAYYSSDGRPLPVTHGYVCSVYDPSGLFHDPDQWFYLSFADYNVNVRQATVEQMEVLPSSPTPLWPLNTVLDRVGLTLDQFITAVRGSFDAENNKTLVYLEVDYSQPEGYELAAQLLRWIYHFLPFAMRREADYSTCNHKYCSGGDYTIVLVPAGVAQSAVRPSQVGFGYLFSKGQVTHNRSSKRVDFDTSGSPYALWLEQVIRQVAGEEPQQAVESLAQLKEIYAYFDRLVRALPEDEQCKTENYDGALWAYLRGKGMPDTHPFAQADEAALGAMEEESGAIQTLLSLGNGAEIRALAPYMLQRGCLACKQGYSATWVKLLTQIEQAQLIPAEYDRHLETVLSIYLARALDEAPEGGVGTTYEDYVALREGGGSQSEDITGALETAFFPTEEKMWQAAGVSGTPEAGLKRAHRWVGELLGGCSGFGQYLRRVEDVLSRADRFQEAHCAGVIRLLEQCAGQVPQVLPQQAAGDLAACCASEDRMVARMPAQEEVIHGIYDGLKETAGGVCRQRIQESRDLLATLEELEQGFRPHAASETAKECWGGLVELTMSRVREGGKSLKLSQLGGLLPDREDLHRGALGQMNVGLSLKADRGLCGSFYTQTCRFILQSESYTHLTKDLLLHLEEEAQIQGIDLRKAAQMGNANLNYRSLLLLADFVRGRDYSLQGFQDILESWSPEEEDRAAKVRSYTLSALYRMFRAGAFSDLGSDLVDCYYYAALARSREDKAQAHGEVFKALIGRKGGEAWLDLLDQYPTSPQQEPGLEEQEEKRSLLGKLKLPKRGQEEEFQPRPGAYPWMKTTTELMDAIGQVVADGPLFERMMGEDDGFCPSLMECLMDLAPEGTVHHRQMKRINTMAWENYLNSSYQSNEVTKELKALKKSGAFDA